MNENYICPICLIIFNEDEEIQPYILECGHYFCKSCLIKEKENIENTIKCPICKLISPSMEFYKNLLANNANLTSNDSYETIKELRKSKSILQSNLNRLETNLNSSLNLTSLNYHSIQILLSKADTLVDAIPKQNKKLLCELAKIIKCLNDMINKKERKIELLKEIVNRTKELINDAKPCLQLKKIETIAFEYWEINKDFKNNMDLNENETELYLQEKNDFLLNLEKRYLPNFSNCKKNSDFSLIAECLKNEITNNSSKIRIGVIGKSGNF